MNQTQSDSIMTVKEVAFYLKVSKSTVYRLVHAKEIPCCKIGGAWRFSRAALDDWLNSQYLNSLQS